MSSRNISNRKNADENLGFDKLAFLRSKLVGFGEFLRNWRETFFEDQNASNSLCSMLAAAGKKVFQASLSRNSQKVSKSAKLKCLFTLFHKFFKEK